VTLSRRNVTSALYSVNQCHKCPPIQQNVWHQSGNDAWNNVLLSSRRNSGMVVTALTYDGRAFRHVKQLRGRHGRQCVERRIDGATRVDVEADRRRQRPPTSATRWRVSARYSGTVPCRQQCVRTHSRNWILSVTFNQWSSRRSGFVCSDLAENSKRAAAFKTDCSRCNSPLEIPAMTELQ